MEVFKVTTEVYADADIKSILAELKCEKVTIITDAMMVKVGLIAKVEDALKKSDIQYDIFDGVEMNPSLESVKKALDQVIDFSPETIIAVGGGSTLDSAKAVRYFLKRTGIDIPVIAIPTTSGTGSEVTSYAVITDTVNSVKIPIKDEEMMPKIAILDPEFTRTLPKSVVADGGIDALTHAIEGYITKGAHVISDMFELKAIEMIGKHLRGAVADKNLTDMEGMSIAQYVAGMGFSNVGLGIVHSMAHPLGAVYDIPHGVANALLLPIVMEFNMSACIDKYGDIARAMGVDTTGMTKEEAAKAAVEAVRQLSKDVHIPQTLREINIPESGLPKLSKDALADVCTGGNPKDVTLEDIEKLYNIAY